jgi:hypothetical protein
MDFRRRHLRAGGPGKGGAAAGDIDVSVNGRRRLAVDLLMPTAVLPFWRRLLLLIRWDIV